jgi:hypothetical protein
LRILTVVTKPQETNSHETRYPVDRADESQRGPRK